MPNISIKNGAFFKISAYFETTQHRDYAPDFEYLWCVSKPHDRAPFVQNIINLAFTVNTFCYIASNVAEFLKFLLFFKKGPTLLGSIGQAMHGTFKILSP